MEKEKGISGPHLSAAFLCERVLREVDNTCSFIRVTERFNVVGPLFKMPQAAIQTNMVISLKTGSMGAGKHSVKVSVNDPDGNVMLQHEVSVYFEAGEDHAQLIIMPMVLAVKQEGIYWIDVLFEDAIITKIPFRVQYQRVQMPGSHPPQVGL